MELELGAVDATVRASTSRTVRDGVSCRAGMKHNIVRYFVETHDVTLVVVPFDYDLEANPL